MIRIIMTASAMLVSIVSVPATASDLEETTAVGVEEIIVTGSRIDDYEPDIIPAVTLIKRADFMIQQLRIVNDTRKEDMRADEMYKTIAAMLKKAKSSKTFTLGTGDNHFTPLTDDNYKLDLQGVRSKEDTSETYLLVKAPLNANNSANAIAESIRKFIRDIKPEGRTEVFTEGDLGLSIIKPERYRYELIEAIAKDANITARTFGPDYRVVVENLEYPLLWQRQGLDTMALYLLYTFDIVPPSGK